MAEPNTDSFAIFEVIDTHSRESMGQVGDVSKDGIMLLTTKPLPLKQTKEVLIHLPSSDAFYQEMIPLDIDPLWIKNDETQPDLYRIGCQFAKAERSDLEMLIRQFGAKRSTRKNLLFYLDVYEKDSEELLGHLGDISDTGIMLITSYTMPLGETREIIIKLPEDEEFSDRTIEADVEIRWSRPDVNPEFNCVGCLFTHIAPKYKPLIKKVQEVLGFDDVV
ncbi:PilZ domain-containing protein [Beggiatoa alba B18LD]|uniref:PilZ domain-containing protein n=1 Tax=Beggiatoa alba B18LD TaxID=395493 RepID=I3CJ26_9GAMM|nr:PilZ domain-containing protein [Beggiatoa alba]EIJ43619.1 PilZ domain-containing protein [Beggiatoa alba B18LD]